jgi:multiple sugar transport system ATP-binding protein
MKAYPFLSASEGKVILGLRPEHITIADDQDTSAIDAELLFIEPMGADTLCWFQVAGQKFSARLNPVEARSLKKNVRVRFALERASLFDCATEKRI